MSDPWTVRLSDYVDGELDARERAELERHLGACGECSALVRDLRGLVARARSLEDRPPERDPWPALVVALQARRRRTLWIAALAAGVLLAASLVLTRRGRAPVEPNLARAGGAYLLLLHEPADAADEIDPAEHAAIVERYAAWARDLGERCAGGDELAERGWELRASADGVTVAERELSAGIGGYFLVLADDDEQALELARGSPHLDRGGWIELRRIQTR